MKNDPSEIIQMFNKRLTEDAMLQIDYHSLNEEKVRITAELNDLIQELERQQECLKINNKFNLDF